MKLSEIISKYILYLGLHEKDKNHGSIYFLVDKNDFYILSHKYRNKQRNYIHTHTHREKHSGAKFSQCLFNEISH